jgi:hypothetical protein
MVFAELVVFIGMLGQPTKEETPASSNSLMPESLAAQTDL